VSIGRGRHRSSGEGGGGSRARDKGGSKQGDVVGRSEDSRAGSQGSSAGGSSSSSSGGSWRPQLMTLDQLEVADSSTYPAASVQSTIAAPAHISQTSSQAAPAAPAQTTNATTHPNAASFREQAVAAVAQCSAVSQEKGGNTTDGLQSGSTSGDAFLSQLGGVVPTWSTPSTVPADESGVQPRVVAAGARGTGKGQWEDYREGGGSSGRCSPRSFDPRLDASSLEDSRSEEGGSPSCLKLCSRGAWFLMLAHVVCVLKKSLPIRSCAAEALGS